MMSYGHCLPRAFRRTERFVPQSCAPVLCIKPGNGSERIPSGRESGNEINGQERVGWGTWIPSQSRTKALHRLECLRPTPRGHYVCALVTGTASTTRQPERRRGLAEAIPQENRDFLLSASPSLRED